MRKRSILIVASIAFAASLGLIFYGIYSLQHESSSWSPAVFAGTATSQTKSSLDQDSQSSIPWRSYPQSPCTDLTRYYILDRAPSNALSACSIWIQTSTLQEMPSSIFQFKNLKSLVVVTNNLESVPSQIGTLTGLGYLDIWSFRNFATAGGVTYSATGPDFFDGHYVFGRNAFTIIPPEVGNLTNLVQLEIIGSNLKRIPSEVGNLRQLQELNLSDGQLTVVPPEIGSLTNLSILELSGNAITELPDAIYHLTNLSTLVLSDNQVDSISPKIGQLTRLTELNLTDNDISALPKEIGNLKNLTYLSVRGNKLTELPSEIGNLTNLQQLIVSFNQLKSLPDSIGNLTNLTNLSVSFNNLTTLPSSISNLKKLKTLYLYGNPISPQELRRIQSLVPQATVSFKLIGGAAYVNK